ncbi:MAG: uroporphyrinogen decarboxylase family protein [Anaerolineales bacterium]|jgi:uroporphyrinogen decarboxylase
MPMTSRERVLAAIHHNEPDRVPLVLGVSNATGLKMKPYQDLKKLLGIEAEDRYLYDWPELGTANPDEKTLERLGSDVRGVWDLEPQSIMARNRKREPHSPYIDSWGGGQKEISPGVWFPGVHPMAEANSLEEIEQYAWPDMLDPTRVKHVSARAEQLAQENRYAILATPWLLFPFERAFAMQGMDRFLGNMIRFPDFAQTLLKRIAELCKDLMDVFLGELGENVDIIKIGDDLGMQTGLLISPDMYRQMLKPIHADFISFIKARTKAKVFFHTDGDIFDLIEDLVEIGVDILNPIQTSAGRMADLSALKKRYGKEIVFCGAIDTHRVLPHGTPDEVRQEVQRVIRHLGPGGGYMVAAVHTIMDDVPAENILAMTDAIDEFGKYPLNA